MDKNTEIQSQKLAELEAILFWFAEPVSKKKLAELLSVKSSELDDLLNQYRATLENRSSGISLIDNGEEVTLTTSSLTSELITRISKQELTRDLGKAGLDTLSIILYDGPVSRADVDYIRGVSSHYIIRNLQIRGLVYKIENPQDERKILYAPTIELLTYLGVTRREDLPDFDKIRLEIATIKQSKQNETVVE